MSVNWYLPHLLIVPEDDANRQLANGFELEVGKRQIQVLPPAGGWIEVLNKVNADHRDRLINFPLGLIAVLIDFDRAPTRRDEARNRLAPEIRDKVFILGAVSEPEDLRRAGLGSYEAIGVALARDCREGVRGTWGHEQLRHNVPEAERLRARAGWLFNT